jgi:hypothetical protein
MVAEHEWTVRIQSLMSFPRYNAHFAHRRFQCLNAENYLVAHYNLKPPDRPAYGTSGNVLTVYESFAHLSIGGSYSRTSVRNHINPCPHQSF